MADINESLAFLSHSYPRHVFYDGIQYDNAEAAIQAQREPDWNDRLSYAFLTPGQAQEKAKAIRQPQELNPEILHGILSAKFRQDAALAQKLLDLKYGTDPAIAKVKSELAENRAGKSLIVDVRLVSIYGAPFPDMARCHAILYGDPDAMLDKHIPDKLKDLLKTAKHELHFEYHPDWSEMSTICSALEKFSRETGIPYQIDENLIRASIAV